MSLGPLFFEEIQIFSLVLFYNSNTGCDLSNSYSMYCVVLLMCVHKPKQISQGVKQTPRRVNALLGT